MEQTLGKRIVQHRKQLGLTQDALAEKLGITAQAVSKWENDQSCPDITMLPKLAAVFGISTDALLGISQNPPVCESTDNNKSCDMDESSNENGSWKFKFEASRRDGILFGTLVLLIGCLYLVASLFRMEIGLWDIIWPSALVIYGIQGIYPKFSFLGLGAILFGAFSLVNKFFPLNVHLDNGVIVAVVILLIGGSLLMDALGKPRQRVMEFTHNGPAGSHNPRYHYRVDETSFQFDGAFGDRTQFVSMPMLRSGMINTSFGDYEIDLSGVAEVAPDCRVEVNTSFGDVTIDVPSKFEVRYSADSAFANVEFDGRPDTAPAGVIQLNASVSFGNICIEYI